MCAHPKEYVLDRACLARSVEADTRRRVETLVLGGGRTCAVGADGKGDCWGVKKPRPIAASEIRSFAMGATFDCVLARDGTVRCADDKGQWDVRSAAGEPVASAARSTVLDLEWHPSDCSALGAIRCAAPAHRLEKCAAAPASMGVLEANGLGASWSGKKVSVRGRLRAGGMMLVGTQFGCRDLLGLEGEPRGSSRSWLRIEWVGEYTDPSFIRLGLASCSSIEPLGQWVAATGLLRIEEGRSTTTLTDVTMCLL